MKNINISLVGTPHDYRQGLLPLIITTLGYRIHWSKPSACDLLIYGPFFRPREKHFRWLPKPARPLASNIANTLKNTLGPRSTPPLTLFHTGENVRHDSIKADYVLSYDLAVRSERHFRMPYWMEMVDWSEEGVRGNHNPRFGQLLSIPRMMQPLGKAFLERPRCAALFTTHLREPRATLVRAIEDMMPLQGFGPHFNKNIRSHHDSGFNKIDILQGFAFNLCPENGLYPGYYTEKIPEAFLAGCLPLTWTDANVRADFNDRAFVNLEPMSWQEFEPLKELLNSPGQLAAYAEQPLMLARPSIEPLMAFVDGMLRQALS